MYFNPKAKLDTSLIEDMRSAAAKARDLRAGKRHTNEYRRRQIEATYRSNMKKVLDSWAAQGRHKLVKKGRV